MNIFRSSNLYKRLNHRQFIQFTYRSESIKTWTASCKDSQACKAGVDSVDIKRPMEMFLAAASACGVHTIQVASQMHKVKLDHISCNIQGDYNIALYMAKEKGPNTWKRVTVNIEVESHDDPVKVKQAVELGLKQCPIVNTIRLAGTEVIENIKLI